MIIKCQSWHILGSWSDRYEIHGVNLHCVKFNIIQTGDTEIDSDRNVIEQAIKSVSICSERSFFAQIITPPPSPNTNTNKFDALP